MKYSESIRIELSKLQREERKFRDKVCSEIFALVAGNSGSDKSGILIDDGPTRVSSWDDEVDEVVVACTTTHIIIDEAGNESSVEFKDVSTETLVDTYAALEAQITDGVNVEDFSDVIK